MKFIRTSVPVVLLLTLILLGCDSNDPGSTTDEITGIRMIPDSVAMEVGQQADFSIVAVTESGDEIQDHDLDVRWWSTDTTVFTVSSDGVAIGQGAGEAWCMAEAEALSKSQRFVGRDSARVVMLF